MVRTSFAGRLMRLVSGVGVAVVLASGMGACGGKSGGGSPTTPTPTVTSVTVSGTGSLKVGETSQMSATAHYSNSTQQSCSASATWQSSNTSVASVSSGGMITALAAGETDIRATFQSTTGSTKVTVAAATFALTGTVREDPGGAAIADAKVEILGGANAGKSATTDTAGSYRITGVAPGTFTVRASKAGFESSERGANVTGDSTLDFTLRRTAPSSFTLSGRVMEEGTASGVAGAKVEIEAGTNAGRSASTDPSGYFVLSGLSAGSCDMKVSKDGYENTYRRGVNLSGNASIDFSLRKSGGGPSPSPNPNPTCGGASVPGSAPCGTPTAKCNDGTWSCSQNRSGTCSSHGGVACWVCPGPLCNPVQGLIWNR